MTKPTATCLIRPLPHYRLEVFRQALTSLGYEFTNKPKKNPGPDDLLVTWNRYGVGHGQARIYEAAGARVIVAENGYLPMRKTKKAFALALNHHNGAGEWYQESGGNRHELLDVELQEWRKPNNTAILLPQRGIGPPGVAMPRQWLENTRRKLATMRIRNITRAHPGTNKTVKPLEEDLAAVGFAVTWASGAGLKAICYGLPVFHELLQWIGAPAARQGYTHMPTNPFRGDRIAMLERVAWAQCSVEELETAEPIARLLSLRRD